MAQILLVSKYHANQDSRHNITLCYLIKRNTLCYTIKQCYKTAHPTTRMPRLIQNKTTC